MGISITDKLLPQKKITKDYFLSVVIQKKSTNNMNI